MKMPDLHMPTVLRQNGACVNVTVKVTGMWRVRLGIWFIKLGCWISGVGCKVD